jgi:hypothetical protein
MAANKVPTLQDLSSCRKRPQQESRPHDDSRMKEASETALGCQGSANQIHIFGS